MRHTRRLLISLLISFSLAGLVLLTGRAQKAPPAEEQEPPGDWSLSIGVYTGPGYESLPVMADSVKSVGSKGLAVTEVTLKNNTTKFVKQVRLQWQVSERPDLGREKEDTRVILVHGRTPRITVDLSPGEERLLEYLVVSFAKIYKPLLRDGALKGKFRMEIVAGQIVYGDGTVWEWDEPTDAASDPSPTVSSGSKRLSV